MYKRQVIGTVKGDLHDIGKNLVASMLEGCGFEVINIGIDVTCDKFVEAVKENPVSYTHLLRCWEVNIVAVVNGGIGDVS